MYIPNLEFANSSTFNYSVAYTKNIEALILGAFGCSVYGQDPELEASIFKSFLTDQYSGCFKKVVFPVDHTAGVGTFIDMLCGRYYSY